MSRNGFKGDYSNKKCASFSAFVRANLGISHIPILRLKEGIRNLYVLANKLNGRQRRFSVQMIKYVQKTWINGSFPPSTWMMFDHRGITTNNHSEGYNNRLGNNRTIGKHPNCYRWAETVREELRNSENEAIMARWQSEHQKNESEKSQDPREMT